MDGAATELIEQIVKNNGFSGYFIAIALVYLAVQVRALQHAMTRIVSTVDDHRDRIATIEGRLEDS